MINELTQTISDGSSLTSSSAAVSLTAGSFVPIKVEYYEITGDAFIFLEWSSTSQSAEIIPSSQFYTPETSALPITGSTVSSSSVYSPMQVTAVAQGDSSTYAQDALTIVWTAPADYGCNAITGYDITVDDGTPSTTSVGLVTTTTIPSLTPGQAYSVTVQAANGITGSSGVASTPITLTPATLPNAPASITVSLYEQNALTLTWPSPTDTGIGDTSIAITNYKLEVDKGYGDGFETLSEQTTLNYKDSGLIAGRTYKYRVSAQSFLGYGPTSAEYSFIPVVKPSKPENPPRNDASLTTETEIHIEFDAVEDDGGSPITRYLIYYDDGLDGLFGSGVDNGLSLTYTYTGPPAVAGNTYRFKYAAENGQGVGEQSDEVAILLAELPGAPQNFERIDETTLSAGIIRVKWEIPSSIGGTGITGYAVYQDDKLIYEASNTEYTHTIYSLSIGTSYKIGVAAINAVGEGTKSELTLIAASVPSQMNRPTLTTSSMTDITVGWSEPSYNGGNAITGYKIRRDDGPGTAFQTELLVTTMSHTYSSLLNSVLTYRIQVAAVNDIGTGEYSIAYEFYAAATSSSPQNFVVLSQSTSLISLDWEPPASDGGCDINEYKLWMEDILDPGFNLVYNGFATSAEISVLASKTYKFQVAAVACRMTSSTADLTVLSGSVPTKIANAPTVSSYPSATSAIISFEPPASNGGYAITEFRVYVDNNYNQTLVPIGPHSFTLSGLADTTNYKIQISSKNIIDESELSDALIFTFEIPYTPDSLTLTSTVESINLAWTQPSSGSIGSVDGYKIYVNDGQGSEPVFVFSTEGSPSILTHTITTDGNGNSLVCGYTYRVQVTSVNEITESTPVEQSIIVGATPSAPESLSVIDSVPNNKITLSWKSPSNTGCLPIRSYILTVDSTDVTGLAITGDMTQVDYDISGDGAYGKTLTLSLRAKNDKTEGSSSDTISVTVGSVPDAPSSLALISRPSKTSLIVEFTPDTLITNNVETTEYKVYRINSDGTESLLSTTSKSANYQVTLPQDSNEPLTTGDSYTLVVRAVNYWGESTDSNQLVVVMAQVPSQPPTPVLLSSTSVSLTLQISPSTDNGGVPIQSYIVSYDEGQTGTFTDDPITDLSNLQWTKSGLGTSALVDIKIVAVNSIDKSEESNLVTFVVAGVPATPAQPTLSGNPVEQQDDIIAATIQWTAPSDEGSAITGYTLYYKKSSNSDAYLVAYDGNGRPDILEFTVTGLSKSVQYLFRVSATNRAGESTASPTLSLLAAGVPSKPLNPVITSTSLGSITVSWDAPESNGGKSLDGYKVQYKLTSDSAFTDSATIQATTSTLTLTANSEYSIRVFAINSVGPGEASSSVFGYASDVPSGLAKPTVSSREETSVRLVWTAPTSTIDITGYQVYANEGDGSNPTVLVYDGESVPTKISANITGLNTGSEYSFLFYAFNAAGRSAASPIEDVVIGKLPDPPVSPPTLTGSTSSSISISWEPSPNSYNIPIVYYHIYQDGVKLTPALGPTTYTKTINSLATGAAHSFAVSAESTIGEGSVSQSRTYYAVDVPSAPSLSVQDSTRDTCTVSWTEVTPPTSTVIEGYVILINDGLDGDDFAVAYNGEFNPSKFSAVLEGLSARRSYLIKGYAINKAGVGTSSSSVT